MKRALPVVLLPAAYAVATIFVGNGLQAAESLIDNPPFKTVDRGEVKPEETIATQGSLNERFVLSGFYDDGATVKFSIQDQKNSKPYWIAVGETFEGVKVDSWDAEKYGVVLAQGGKKEMLILRDVKSTRSARPVAPMFNPVKTQVPTTYPSPPPSLPKPTQLMEKLRREQARKQDK